MKLLSFQIFNCFGFQDSKKVILSDSNNFIYILGRNSSGKSSLMNSIKYLAPSIIPSKQPNFHNFIPNGDSFYFEAEFFFENSRMDFATFKNDFRTLLTSQTVDSLAMPQNPQLKTMVDEIDLVYEETIENLNKEKQCVVTKFGTGNYYFALLSDSNSSFARRDKINEIIKSAKNTQNQFLIHGAWRNADIDFNKIENLIFNQFPSIFLFNEQFSLKDSLPNKINENWESEASEFTKTFLR